jgi:chemotaxis protein CheD
MIKRTLNINEIDATSSPVLYTCHGVGSCIALFLTDRLKNLKGGAHISFPSSASANQCKGAFELISELRTALKRLGSDLIHLRAKLAGGAKVFDSSFNIGEENRDAVLEYLVQKKIYIAASDLGGHVARTVQFNSETGELKISTSEPKVYSI